MIDGHEWSPPTVTTNGHHQRSPPTVITNLFDQCDRICSFGIAIRTEDPMLPARGSVSSGGFGWVRVRRVRRGRQVCGFRGGWRLAMGWWRGGLVRWRNGGSMRPAGSVVAWVVCAARVVHCQPGTVMALLATVGWLAASRHFNELVRAPSALAAHAALAGHAAVVAGIVRVLRRRIRPTHLGRTTARADDDGRGNLAIRASLRLRTREYRFGLARLVAPGQHRRRRVWRDAFPRSRVPGGEMRVVVQDASGGVTLPRLWKAPTLRLMIGLSA